MERRCFSKEKSAWDLDLNSLSVEKGIVERMKDCDRFGIRQDSSLEQVLEIFRTGLILW